MPDKKAVRFDYDCKIYREGIIDDIICINKVLRGGGKKILDVGSGLGSIPSVLAGMGYSVYGIDVVGTADYYNHLNLTKEKFALIWQDLEKNHNDLNLSFYHPYEMPFPDSTFDAVLFYASLEHISAEHVMLSLKESHRILKPEGKLFIFRCPDELSWSERLGRRLNIPGHDLLYGEKQLKNLLHQSHFHISTFTKTDLFPAFLPEKFQFLLDMHGFWLLPLQDILIKTTLGKWAHHFRIIAQKA